MAASPFIEYTRDALETPTRVRVFLSLLLVEGGGGQTSRASVVSAAVSDSYQSA